MYLGQRVIDNATDISIKVNDWRSLTHTFAYTSGNYLYVGSEVPFNNLYFDVGTANAVSGTTCAVSVWFGQTWNTGVDIIDETASGTTGLAQSGRITFHPAYNTSWDLAQRSSDVTGLSSFNIFDMYWARFSWAASLSGTTTLKYIGQKFAEDGDLFVLYPDLNNSDLFSAVSAGKTNWNDQHFAAAEFICSQLISKQIMWSRGQILDPKRLMTAAIHKAAHLIYGCFGKPYEQNALAALQGYNDTINMGNFAIDRSNDGILQPTEKAFSQLYLSR